MLPWIVEQGVHKTGMTGRLNKVEVTPSKTLKCTAQNKIFPQKTDYSIKKTKKRPVSRQNEL